MRKVTPLLLVAACGGGATPASSTPTPADTKMHRMMDEGMAMETDEGSTFGPLEVGADWQTYTRVNTTSFHSPTHGGRMVDVLVNDVGLAAYQGGDDVAIPVGAIIVKTSREESGAAGPIFVMEKRAAGFDPDHEDWYYAIHWADPPEPWATRLGGPLYWRTPSKKADYCWECHESFERELGGVPVEHRAW
jgi:hypothetical protein